MDQSQVPNALFRRNFGVQILSMHQINLQKILNLTLKESFRQYQFGDEIIVAKIFPNSEIRQKFGTDVTSLVQNLRRNPRRPHWTEFEKKIDFSSSIFQRI